MNCLTHLTHGHSYNWIKKDSELKIQEKLGKRNQNVYYALKLFLSPMLKLECCNFYGKGAA